MARAPPWRRRDLELDVLSRRLGLRLEAASILVRVRGLRGVVARAEPARLDGGAMLPYPVTTTFVAGRARSGPHHDEPFGPACENRSARSIVAAPTARRREKIRASDLEPRSANAR